MNRVSPGFLLIAFFLALLGLAGLYAWKKSQVPEVVAKKPAPKPTTYLVASADLPAGRIIHASDFMRITVTSEQRKSKNWPALLMADGKQLLNRRLKVAHKQGQPFPPDAFYPEGIEPDVTEQVPAGLRAVALPIEAEGLPPKVSPGAMVDVLFTTRPSKDVDLPELTTRLVERAQIISIDHNATPGTIATGKSASPAGSKSDKHVVTLAVTPEIVLKLKAVERYGVFALSLRNEADQDDASSPSDVALSDLFDISDPELPPEPFTAEVFRRGQRQTLSFDALDNRRLASQSKRTPKSSSASPKYKRSAAPLGPGPEINDDDTILDDDTEAIPQDPQVDIPPADPGKSQSTPPRRGRLQPGKLSSQPGVAKPLTSVAVDSQPNDGSARDPLEEQPGYRQVLKPTEEGLVISAAEDDQ